MKYVLTLIFFLYVIFLSLFSRADFPSTEKDLFYLPYLAERPLTEDGFYSLKIAWNIGTGKGVTYNFDQPTTGFQPLYVILLSIVAFINSVLGGDKISFLRLVILCSGIIALFLTYLFYRFLMLLNDQKNRKIIYIIISLLVLFNFKLFLNLFNGMETGLYMIFLVLSISQTHKIIEEEKKKFRMLRFGLTLGLTVLARNDFILIASIILLTLTATRRIRLKDLAFISLILFLVICPWLAYIFSVQGSIIPTSAAVQSGLTSYELSYRIDQFFYSIFTNYIPFIHSGQTQSIAVYILALVFFLYLYKFQKPLIKSFIEIPVIKYWLVGILITSFVYLVFASQPYFFFRYLSIHMVISIPFLILLIKRFLTIRSLKVKNIFVVIVVGIFFINAGYYFHYPKVVSGLALRPGYIKKHFNESNKIGMPQSGISGYFFDNVINLDGKVNYSALEAIKSNRLFDYIEEENIDVLIEWKEWFEISNAKSLSKNFVRYLPDIVDERTIVYIKAK